MRQLVQIDRFHQFFDFMCRCKRVFAVNDRYGGNRFLFGIYDGKVDLYVPGSHLLGTSLVNDNEWHFISVVFDRDAYGYIYIDGNLELQEVFNQVLLPDEPLTKPSHLADVEESSGSEEDTPPSSPLYEGGKRKAKRKKKTRRKNKKKYKKKTRKK